MPRKAKVTRKTTEVDITLELNLDGSGSNDVKTSIPFFDHMLSLFAKHGLFDLKVRAKGDVEVDFHHTVEDVGLCLGEALKKAVGDKSGIRRYGSADVPMMDSLSSVVLDISGRPYFRFNSTKHSTAVMKGEMSSKKGDLKFNMSLIKEFMTALSNGAGIDLHIINHYGSDFHHSAESIFKALGRALSMAVSKDPRIKGVMSTKGRL